MSGGNPDYTAPSYITNNRFVNVDMNSFAFIASPEPAWANPADCGNFPCTGPHNVLMDFKDNTFEGTSDTSVANPNGGNFQIIPNNPGFSPFIS